ncbi:MAG: transglutaminase family protein [Pirellulaceae bacterium]
MNRVLCRPILACPRPWPSARAARLLLALAMLAGTLLAGSGCDLASPTPFVVTKPKGPGIAPPPIAQPAVQPAAAPAEDSSETWDVYFIQRSRVGYGHTTIAEVEEAGQTLIHTENKSLTTLARAGQSVSQSMTLASWETPEGGLVRFSSRMTTGPGELVASGRVEGDKLIVETSTLGSSESQTIPWQADWGGYFAAEQSLKRQPMQPGEQRTVRGLNPILNMPSDTTLSATEYETVKLPGGEAKLLRIDSVIDLIVQKLDTVLWVNEQGETLKSLVPALGQEAFRTTKQDALRKVEGGGFDLMVSSIVKLTGKMPNPLTTEPLTTRRVVYLAKVKSGQIDGTFAESLSQRVAAVDEQTARITVLAIRPDVPPSPDLPPTPPTAEDLAANNLVQSEDPLVIEMAAKAAPAGGDAWQTAQSLERYVSQSIEQKNFSQAFATAGEVARSLEGDCTEHSVLLAALCRARKIPARVAFGLVYYPPQQGFAYHMWNEVWIGDRWVPLDGTLGLGGVGADRLKLADSSLAGSTGFSDLLAVLAVFGRLELEVVSAE